jgi:hypothetical protein
MTTNTTITPELLDQGRWQPTVKLGGTSMADQQAL